jgi:hypothetical protein
MTTKAKKKKKPADEAPTTPDPRCYHRINPRGGFIGSHSPLCAAAVAQTKHKIGRATCDLPVEIHARFEGHCSNVCGGCGKVAGERGAVLATVDLVEDRPTTVLRRVVADDAHVEPAEPVATSPAVASEPETGSAATVKDLNLRGHEKVAAVPLLERIAERTKDQPLLRTELSPKDRKLARRLSEDGVIIRQTVGRQISYYPIEATA